MSRAAAGPDNRPDDSVVGDHRPVLADRRSAHGGALIAVFVAIATSVAIAFADVHPTGRPVVDVIVVCSLAFATTLCGARAPLGRSSWIALVVGATTSSVLPALAAVLLHVAGRWVRPEQRSAPIAGAVVTGGTLVVAAASRLDIFLGASSVVAILAATALALPGLMTMSTRPRRLAFSMLAAAGVVLLAATVGFAIAARTSADDLGVANDHARTGLRQLSDGNVSGARQSFRSSADEFESVEADLGGFRHAVASFVPVVAQHRQLALDVVHVGGEVTRALDQELDGFDLDSLTIIDGRVDIDQIIELREPLTRIVALVEELRDVVEQDQSPWIVEPVASRLAEVAVDLDNEFDRADTALEVLDLAPQMLGVDGPRTYFIAFTTPAEARGLGGLMGNWAEITLDDGRIELSGFGRSDDLDDAAAIGERSVSGPDDWLARYGRFGFTNHPSGGVGIDPWKNLTMSPQMSSTSEVIAELYPQSGGRDIDGVFVLDVETLASLLKFSGPIELEVPKRTLRAGDAVPFLLNGQYDIIDVAERADLLETVSFEVIDRLLNGGFPAPTELIDQLGPKVERRRLAGWMADDTEQALFRRIGLDGDLPDPVSDDALAVVLNNAVGNKIDYFLRAEADYDVVIDRGRSTAAATVTLEMTNTAPTSNEPQYVIGNPLGLPRGSNRTYVTLFTRLPVDEVMVNGEPASARFEREAGYFTTSVFVETASGATSTVVARLAGTVDLTDGFDLIITGPPTVEATPVEIRASDDDGQSTIDRLDRPGTMTFDLLD